MAFATWESIAKALGVSRQRLYKLKTRPDWPCPSALPFGDSHIEALRRWRAGFQHDGGDQDGDGDGGGDVGRAYKQIQILLSRERMLHEKLKREITAGQYVSRELLDGSLGGLAQLFIDGLADLEMALPARLAGKAGPQVEKELQRYFDSLRRRIAERAEYELVKVSDMAAKARRGRGRPGVGAESG